MRTWLVFLVFVIGCGGKCHEKCEEQQGRCFTDGIASLRGLSDQSQVDKTIESHCKSWRGRCNVVCSDSRLSLRWQDRGWSLPLPEYNQP